MTAAPNVSGFFARLRSSRVLRRCAFVALALLACRLALWLGLHLVPLPAALEQPAPASLELVDRHNRPLREFAHADRRFTHPTSLAQIPPHLVHATLAAEDKRFWNHPGVDCLATARAAASLVRHRRIVSGGSTITQQLLKISEPQPRPRTFATKFREAAQALRLEQIWTKDRILTEYLNRLDYGDLCFGIAAAAEHFFGKPLADLSPAEAALLAGLPQAPTRLNPHQHRARAVRRQQWILGRMVALGSLDAAAFHSAINETPRLAPARRPFQAPHFVELLRAQQRELFTQTNRVARLRTSLDLELQGIAETAVRTHLARLRGQNVRNAAAVVLDNRTGEVLALVGSEDFFSPTGGQINGAWTPRSAGSTFKPFTYLLALENGAHAATILADVPTDFPTPTGIFSPANYSQHCAGPVRLRLALANSLNIPAVKILASLGGPAPLQQRLQDCGLTTLTRPPAHYGLGLTLGNAEARLLELANAYACLARLGDYQPFRLTRADRSAEHRLGVSESQASTPSRCSALLGPSTPTSIPETFPRAARNRICDPAAAWLIADILSDNAARTASFGVNSPLRFPFPVACKTGTSSDFRDNWAFGYTPEFTVGVWAGNFDGTPMQGVSGVTGAAPILHDVMIHLHERHGTTWFAPPAALVEHSVHPLTGKRLAQPRPDSVREKFFSSNVPPLESPADYDTAGRARLAPEYAAWLATSDNWLAARAVLAAAEPASPVRLVSPLPGTVYFLDPDLPDAGRHVRLRADGPAGIVWQSESLECRRDRDETIAILTAGNHRLTALHPTTGTRAETWIVVKQL